MKNLTLLSVIFVLLIVFPFPAAGILAIERNYITIARDGSGNFTTISEALKNLPPFNYSRIIIFIKNGIYNEKIKIEQDYITLRGEDKEKTIIRFNQLREDWNKNPDAIGPAVVNIQADDIIIENLTIENSQPLIGPHAFAIYGMGTRTILINSKLISKGGDTVSLWNYKTGMYYLSGCYFEGAVDFVCPRGWCFISNSKFYEVKKTASIWHAGNYDITQKFVIKNSSFDGIEGFELGRHHYEAQFFFINCRFSKNLGDKPIYRVTYEDSTKNRTWNWGERNYFYSCHKDESEYNWLNDNWESIPDLPQVRDITPAWTFVGKWDPESTNNPEIVNYKIEKNNILLFYDELITVIGNPLLKSKNGMKFKFHSGGNNNTIRFVADEEISQNDLDGLEIINDSKLIGTTATVNERQASLHIKLRVIGK